MVPKGCDRAGVKSPLLHVQTLSGPEPEELQGTPLSEARYVTEPPRPGCMTLDKHPSLSPSLGVLVCKTVCHAIASFIGFIEMSMLSV